MIKPTVGRVVWFYPGSWDEELFKFRATHGLGPMAAHVVHVWGDRMVNLTVLDPNGLLHPRTSVMLAQEGDLIGVGSAYCEWMPYQKGQAAKTDAAEAKADAAALDVSALAPKRLPAGMTVAEGYRLVEGPDDPIGRAEPIGGERPWEPRQSASMLPHGYQQRGSTGQLFEVRNGGWVRVIENPGRPVPHHGSGP